VVAGASIALLGSTTVWLSPAQTCEREPRPAARLVRFPIDMMAGPQPAEMRRVTEVVGRVVDASGRAVSGVLGVPRPTAGSAGDPLGGGVLTDRRGYFRFNGLAPGQYWFIAIHGAYPFGSTPAMPVTDHLEVAITLDESRAAT
jgi:hypothetical protein